MSETIVVVGANHAGTAAINTILDHYKDKRVVYDKATRRILGAELASSQDVSMGLHMFSLAIEQGYTIDQLKLLDIFFLPHFNAPYNYITMAALGAQ